MTPYITEILQEISDNPDLLFSKYKDQYAVRAICEYAFDKNKRFILPEGEPPYNKDPAPIGMTPANFYQHVKKFYIFLREDIGAPRREQLFIQFLEGIHPDEAKVVLAVKDQNLTSLYPGITAELVEKAGFVLPENMFCGAVPSTTDKAEGVRLELNFSDGALTEESFGEPPVSNPEPSETAVQNIKSSGRRAKKKE